VVLYELLTGLRAFESTSLIDLIHRIGEARLTRPLSEITGVPPEAIDLLRGMMALKPEERFASIGEVRAALQGLRRISGDRRSGRP
jgi:serine/threonine protein kinase